MTLTSLLLFNIFDRIPSQKNHAHQSGNLAIFLNEILLNPLLISISSRRNIVFFLELGRSFLIHTI